MTEGIVHRFKIIQIDKSNAQRPLGFELREVREQRMAVGQAGERIVVRQLGKLLLVLLLFGHVDVRASHLQGVPLLIPFGDAAAIQHPGDGAVFVLHPVQCFVEGGFAVQMIVERIKHVLPVIGVQMLTPDLKLRAQLLGLIAQHGAPAAVIDNQLPGRNIKLP
ncbi:hypothetical protein D3C76_1051410 [compost metagenome]